MSITRWPNAEVAVTMRSLSPTQRAVEVSISTRTPGVAARILGSVSYRVLHQAHCPVAVVRPSTNGGD